LVEFCLKNETDLECRGFAVVGDWERLSNDPLRENAYFDRVIRDLDFLLAKDTIWAKAGHILHWQNLKFLVKNQI